LLTAHLEDRFRDALHGTNLTGRDDSIQFAVEFVRLLSRILPPEVSDEARDAVRRALAARSELTNAEIDVLIGLALAPESRTDISENELRAFGARFGPAEEEAMRAAVAEEINLSAFASNYGSGEALLLLDSLFSVAAVDGVIDREEIADLKQAATELGVDEMLVSALFKKHDVRHATGDFRFTLDGDTYLVGRSNSAEIQLPDPQVSPRHAKLVHSGDGWRVVDLRSGRPTLLNGAPVQSAPLRPGDELRVGPYTLKLDHDAKTLTAFGLQAFSALSVRHLSRKIGKIQLLDDVSFTVFSGEVVALVGASGAGKTTLLNAIAGIAPADSGDVLLDGQDFHTLLAHDRSLVGIVPQEDVVHSELTVSEALFYAGRLRFPRDVTTEGVHKQVDRVVEELDIGHIRNSRIGNTERRGISGGQRKRVSLGQELLTHSTRILFLDEPTSGLDPQTAQDIVSLIRQLADDGRIVFLVTHDVSHAILSMVDHLMVLSQGGRLAWFGPPDEACAYFDVEQPDRIFARLPTLPPAEWGERYRRGAFYRKYVRTRERLLGIDDVEFTRFYRQEIGGQPGFLQYLNLTARYAKVKVRDYTGTAVLLSQAPILGIAMAVVFPEPDTAAIFMLALCALWFGSSAAIRELISERTIWRRERRVGLKVLPYMASKVTVLGALVTLQCTILATMNYVLLQMGGAYGFSFLGLNGVTILTGLVGMSMGLFMSSLFASSEAAVGTLPLVLIPQITFGGLIVKVGDMSLLARLVSWTMITRYAFEASIKTGEKIWVPKFGADRGEPLKITGALYDLGFRTSAVDDMGLPMPVLVLVLLAFLAAFLVGATLLTRRTPER